MAIKFGTDIHGGQKIKPNDFGNPLTIDHQQVKKNLLTAGGWLLIRVKMCSFEWMSYKLLYRWPWNLVQTLMLMSG